MLLLEVKRDSFSLSLVVTRLSPHALPISLLLCLSGFVRRAETTLRQPLQDTGAAKHFKMALHVPKAPGFAQMLKDGAKVS